MQPAAGVCGGGQRTAAGGCSRDWGQQPAECSQRVLPAVGNRGGQPAACSPGRAASEDSPRRAASSRVFSTSAAACTARDHSLLRYLPRGVWVRGARHGQGRAPGRKQRACASASCITLACGPGRAARAGSQQLAASDVQSATCSQRRAVRGGGQRTAARGAQTAEFRTPWSEVGSARDVSTWPRKGAGRQDFGLHCLQEALALALTGMRVSLQGGLIAKPR